MIAILVALLVGAAWRRWFGSARPNFVVGGLDPWWRRQFGILRPDRGAPWRGAQIVLGIAALYWLNRWGGDSWWRGGIDVAVVMLIVIVSAHTRDPFIWIAKTLRLPSMWGTKLNGPEPWAEVIQGATLWCLAVAL